jgi:hypothetical protein
MSPFYGTVILSFTARPKQYHQMTPLGQLPYGQSCAEIMVCVLGLQGY